MHHWLALIIGNGADSASTVPSNARYVGHHVMCIVWEHAIVGFNEFLGSAEQPRCAGIIA